MIYAMDPKKGLCVVLFRRTIRKKGKTILRKDGKTFLLLIPVEKYRA